ncbi:MAG: XRE family transcriptional regulator [Gemmatimonadetes bacterium]|nr:MAG: XRE family transcriptional regulator [Gemmatimonadota bacterium]
MDVPFVILHRLEELGLEQQALARAANVTESYISQLLTRRKAPPAPNRTDIYDRMDKFLKLPSGELAKLADLQRKEELKRELGDEPAPLFHEVRELILRKCNPERQKHVRAIFEQQPFGELERLVTQTLLDVVKRVAHDELENDYWLRMVARLSRRSYEEMRVVVLEFLDTDIFHVSAENCVAFLDPLIESWDIDLATFGLEIVLNHSVVPGQAKRFDYVEREAEEAVAEEPGLQEFLQDSSLSGTATATEVEFLKRLKFQGRRPTPLYYYRELQNLRDPLHFRTP